jgi:recombinational DNA repair protein (RecF pathway)
MNENILKPHVCAMCDCHHDVEDSYFSLAGVGPFCSECWESLTDADQALLLDKRLAASEQEIEKLRREIERLSDLLARNAYTRKYRAEYPTNV